MEIVQRLVEVLRANADIIPLPLQTIFGWFLGVFLVLALAVAIGRLIKEPVAWLWPKLLELLQSFLRGAATAIEDPVEHRLLKHMGYIGNLAFSCSGFLIFVVWGIALLFLLAFANPPLTGWRPVVGGGFIALQFYFAAFFKAETGRTLVAYRRWRRGG